MIEIGEGLVDDGIPAEGRSGLRTAQLRPSAETVQTSRSGRRRRPSRQRLVGGKTSLPNGLGDAVADQEQPVQDAATRSALGANNRSASGANSRPIAAHMIACAAIE